MDIRRETCIIIRKNSEYLVGRISFCDDLKWSVNAYDAWRTRDREEAEAVARATGGVMMLFNPITGDRKMIGA